MQRLFMTTYRYRDGLAEDDLRDLTKRFTEVGNAPGTIAHYSRLDGRGGLVIQEDLGDNAEALETTLRYLPWIDFDVTPVTTIEDAFPVIQRVYG